MGNVKDLLGMIPGMGKAFRDIDIDDNAFVGIESIVSSMTPYEREHPEVLNGSRRKRVATGSGNDIAEVNRLIKQFEETRKIMHSVATNKGANMMKMMSGMRRR
jgi:signal recognition particle subunit SRP54